MLTSSHLDSAVVCIVGLGYVGLPLAQAFSRGLKVIGYDVDRKRLTTLRRGNDSPNLSITGQSRAIAKADFVIICVPTPLHTSLEPDLSYISSAAATIGRNMKKGTVVILESTVYPGVTEDVVRPLLESESGLKCGADFGIAYSPERINPGDDEHSVEKVTKVVAGMNVAVTDLVAALYERITPRVFKARDIRTAEAAKLVENIQRDMNIALVNEFSLIFDKLGINTRDVLKAAATKWNFHRYSPGLVGGYCIPVVPHYLIYRSRQAGYEPRMITSGRTVNDCMPGQVVKMTVAALREVGKRVRGARVLVLGLTYKADVADHRYSPAGEIVRELEKRGVRVAGLDPVVPAKNEVDIKLHRDLAGVKKADWDATLITVAHSAFRQLSLQALQALQRGRPVLIDVPGIFDADEAKKAGFLYRSL